MKRSILIVMLDVMVLSVLSLNVGRGGAGFLLPVYQWSSMLQQGLEREKEFRSEIDELRRLAEESARRAREAEELAGRHKELQDTTIRQVETLAAREVEAHARMQEALEKEREATLRAQIASERQQLAEEQAQRALTLKEEADAAARRAAEAAQEARVKAELAARREGEIAQRIEEMREREANLLAQTTETSEHLQQTQQDRDLNRERLELALRSEREAREREQAALRAAEAERKRAEELSVNASLAEERAREAQERMDASQGYIRALSERIVNLRLSEQETQIRLESERELATRLREQLGAIEEERTQSVWVRRDKALVSCLVSLTKRDRVNNELIPYRNEISLPVVMLNDHPYLVAEYEAFGLAWWHVQSGGGLHSVDYRITDIQTNHPPVSLLGPILADAQIPQTVLIPVGRQLPYITGLPPAGIALLKQERVREALAFSPENPDASVRVEVTPMLDERFLSVKNAQQRGGLFSRRELRKGDYLLTETGHFIGIMVTDTTCHVLPPTGLTGASEVIDVPLMADSPNTHDTFVQQARIIRRSARRTNF